MLHRSAAVASGGGAGLWSLEGGRLTRIEDSRAGPAIVLVPSEAMLITVVDLPLPTRRQRYAALPFALEEAVAQPLADLHFALGSEMSPRRHLAAAVARDRMADWMAQFTEAGLGRFILLPDALTLPTPDEGRWNAAFRNGRVIVRTPDGSGFAGSTDLFTAAWTAAGRPLLAVRGQAPPDLPVAAALELAPLSLRTVSPLLDLRQGAYALQTGPSSSALRRVAAIVALAVAAHAGIAVADTLALKRIAARRHAEALALLRQTLPQAADGDLTEALDDLIPASGGGFLPILARASTALRPLGSNFTLRGLAFDGAARTLTLKVEAADLAGLQQVQAALLTAGLKPSAGAATTENGAAVGEIVVRGAGA